MSTETEQQKQEDGGAKSTAKKPASSEPTFSRERCLGKDGVQLAGVARHVIVGALHGDDREEFTRDELNAKVQAFLKRKVPYETIEQED